MYLELNCMIPNKSNQRHKRYTRADSTNNINQSGYIHESVEFFNLDESLKRIDISMQSLIREAQASLSQSSTHTENKKTNIRNYNSTSKVGSGREYYQYERTDKSKGMNLDSQCLKQSQQTALGFCQPGNKKTITRYYHYLQSKAVLGAKNKWRLPILPSFLLVVISYTTFHAINKNNYSNLNCFVLFAMSIYRKQYCTNQSTTLNLMDKIMIQSTSSKGTPFLLDCIHRFNIVYPFASYLFALQ